MTAANLSRRTALVTGATGGIGRMIAARLGELGARVCLLGRPGDRLERARAELASSGPEMHACGCDLARDADIAAVAPALARAFDGRLDFLIHAAGVIRIAPLAAVAPADLDAHYRINVRAPLLLTQAVLPLLEAAHGQIVFLNSSLGTRVKEGAGAYAASKHALKALADTLRAELEPSGVRVLSAFPGNTATPMQEQICREYGKPYRPQAMLQPQDVAAAVVNALLLPATAALTELHILPARRA